MPLKQLTTYLPTFTPWGPSKTHITQQGVFGVWWFACAVIFPFFGACFNKHHGSWVKSEGDFPRGIPFRRSLVISLFCDKPWPAPLINTQLCCGARQTLSRRGKEDSDLADLPQHFKQHFPELTVGKPFGSGWYFVFPRSMEMIWCIMILIRLFRNTCFFNHFSF